MSIANWDSLIVHFVAFWRFFLILMKEIVLKKKTSLENLYLLYMRFSNNLSIMSILIYKDGSKSRQWRTIIVLCFRLKLNTYEDHKIAQYCKVCGMMKCKHRVSSSELYKIRWLLNSQYARHSILLLTISIHFNNGYIWRNKYNSNGRDKGVERHLIVNHFHCRWAVA